MHPRLGPMLVVSGLLGLAFSSFIGGPEAWAWLALMGGGLAHSLLWRAASVRRVNARERRKNAVRLRNAEKRERRHLRASLRIERKLKKVLAEVREHPDLPWGEKVAAAVRALQEGQQRHEAVLVHHKLVTERTAEQLGAVLTRMTPED
jgi:hypothetical protein